MTLAVLPCHVPDLGTRLLTILLPAPSLYEIKVSQKEEPAASVASFWTGYFPVLPYNGSPLLRQGRHTPGLPDTGSSPNEFSRAYLQVDVLRLAAQDTQHVYKLKANRKKKRKQLLLKTVREQAKQSASATLNMLFKDSASFFHLQKEHKYLPTVWGTVRLKRKALEGCFDGKCCEAFSLLNGQRGTL